MNTSSFSSSWVIILAAGKGKRMNAKQKNKVTYEVKGIPMIVRTIHKLKTAGVKNIIVVVGHAKGSVVSLLDSDVHTVEQKKRLGTGHAVKIALKSLPLSAREVMVLYGDDSFLYSPETFKKLLEKHLRVHPALTFLTLSVNNPTGLGRIVRDENNKIVGIVEEKDANDEQRRIKEINPACYVFDVSFLKKYISKMKKSVVTGEYYLTELIELAVLNNEKIETVTFDNIAWRGVNTISELQEAEQLISG